MSTTTLTQRELTILKLCEKGLLFGQIAGSIGCKTSSVRSGVREIYNKLGATNRHEAVAIAYEEGILSGGVIDGSEV